jgi:hypothetical protein
MQIVRLFCTRRIYCWAIINIVSLFIAHKVLCDPLLRVLGGLPTSDLAVFNSGSIGSFVPNQLLFADWDQIATVLRWIE